MKTMGYTHRKETSSLTSPERALSYTMVAVHRKKKHHPERALKGHYLLTMGAAHR